MSRKGSLSQYSLALNHRHRSSIAVVSTATRSREHNESLSPWSEKMAYWAVVQYSWYPESSNLQGRKADLGISNILVETIFCRRICQI